MNTFDAIIGRKSIRSYTAQQISEAELEKLVTAATTAPFAGAPFHLSVVQNAQLLSDINDAAKAGMLSSGNAFSVGRASLPGYEPLYGAPTVFIMSAAAGADMAQANTSCAAENICLAATELGLGSCYMMSSRMAFSSENGAALAARVGIPDGFEFVCAVAVGYTDDASAFASGKKDRATVSYVR